MTSKSGYIENKPLHANLDLGCDANADADADANADADAGGSTITLR